ncbi:hypothetical protein ENUP19_0150G0004 [Entamoeba nuttalli]|uniref:Uncharacterized protein n=1 Tax=Entamoeba nuttalli TaxID=412467 RepID=A0ABQ0DKW9_9EUKA
MNFSFHMLHHPFMTTLNHQHLLLTIYGNEEMNVIQLRSTFIASRYLEFCRDFAECIKSLQPSELGDILFSNDKVIEKSTNTRKELYSTLSKSNLKCKIVHCTCYEGDNRLDAISNEYQWNKEIKQVQSWNNSTLWGELDEDVRANWENQLMLFGEEFESRRERLRDALAKVGSDQGFPQCALTEEKTDQLITKLHYTDGGEELIGIRRMVVS